ncbi:MAG: dethiobiotin synthase [Steroidobacteraceae bacterium]
MKPLRLFVTGTDTGVGKTRVTVGLCRAFAAQGKRVAAMKPVACGCTPTPAGLRNGDALALQAAMTVRASYAQINPYAFAAPIAPHLAANDAGMRIDFDVLDRAYERLCIQSEVLIVEGAGGWLVPLDAERSFAQLAAHWDMQVVVVVGLRLGCLNHALLTIEAVERRGLRVYGWVANYIDPGFERAADNIASLTRRIAAPCLAVLDFAPEADAEAVARTLVAGLPSDVKP